MAGVDSKKQLLNLIRDFASEKSQGERRVVGLKKRIEDLQSQLEAAHVEQEEAKQVKETTEQQLRGYEVELALTDTTFQTLESRISLIQNDISTVGSEVEAFKKEKAKLRDSFLIQMSELNAEIRTLQKSISCNLQKEDSVGTAAVSEGYNFSEKEVSEVASKSLNDKIADVVSQTAKEEEQYQEEEKIQKQVKLELIDLERKMSLMEMIAEGTRSLQDLTRQTSELEQKLAALGEGLQKRCICPNCNKENAEKLGGVLQANGAN